MEYLERVRPTYLENWPEALKAMSLRQASIELSVEEAEALGTNMMELFECFPKPWQRDIAPVRTRLAELLREFPEGAFVRLGSRSPKDALYRREKTLKVRNAAEALALLLGASERMMEDLLLAIQSGYRPHIFVREWLDIPEWTEFRCFMRARKLVGISQYFYRRPYPELTRFRNQIEQAIRGFLSGFRAACHLDDVVFDVVVQAEAGWKVVLLELNPSFEMTDPCLFGWKDGGDFDGSLRIVALLLAVWFRDSCRHATKEAA